MPPIVRGHFFMYIYRTYKLLINPKIKIMRKGIPILMGLIFLCTAHLTYAQVDGGAFNSTGSGHSVVNLGDYQSLGVNPANLGWQKDDHKLHIGFFEFGLSIYSEPLSKSLVFSDLLGNSSDFSSQSQRDEAVKNFTDTELWIQLNTTLFGLSTRMKKWVELHFQSSNACSGILF